MVLTVVTQSMETHFNLRARSVSPAKTSRSKEAASTAWKCLYGPISLHPSSRTPYGSPAQAPSELLAQQPEADGDDPRTSSWLLEVLICEKMATRHVSSSSETLFAEVEVLSASMPLLPSRAR
jgi:hypothetical protein